MLRYICKFPPQIPRTEVCTIITTSTKIFIRQGTGKKFLYVLSGLVAGVVNGLLGSGGGLIIVPMLVRSGLNPRQAHATSILTILPICIVSSAVYLVNSRVTLSNAYPYLIWGIIGSSIGAFILSRINQTLLRKIFGIIMIWAALRLLVR